MIVSAQRISVTALPQGVFQNRKMGARGAANLALLRRLYSSWGAEGEAYIGTDIVLGLDDQK